MPYKITDFRPQGKSSPAQAVEKIIPAQTVYFRITTAGPLHIGCDEVYEPTGFVVDMKTRELVSFETSSFLEKLDADALGKFSDLCKKGTVVSLLELLKFMRSQADLAEGQRIRVPEAFIKHYESTLNLPQNERTVGQELNSFQIKRTAFDTLTGNAYIPGSAIKGAIRTAVLNLRHRQSPRPAQDYKKMKSFEVAREAKSLEKAILNGSFDTDPFRLLKVSDFFSVNETLMAITYAVDKKKKPSEKKSQKDLYQILETVEPGAEFIGSITVLGSPGRNAGITNPISLDEITTALLSFFGSEKQREDLELKNISAQPATLVLNETSLPLRIGRHSGAECVTLEGHRTILVSPPGKEPKRHDKTATTIWLAAKTQKPTTNQGMKPFGWVKFEQLSFGEGQQLREEAERKKSAVLEGLQEKIAVRKKLEDEHREKIARQKQQAAEEAARLALEATARQAAVDREKQALAAMTEVERDVYAIQKPGTSDDTIGSIFKKLDQLQPEDQNTIALALKNYWESVGKWSKKQCPPAQWEKVKKVKTYLIAEPTANSFTPEEQAAIARIDKFANWGDWKNAGIAMESLPLPALKKLKEKFAAWKIKDGKGDKPETWKTINQLYKTKVKTLGQ